MQVSNISGTTNSLLAGSQLPWTSQQVTLLTTLVSQGMPLDEIAQRLNRSLSAIKLQASELGLNLNSK